MAKKFSFLLLLLAVTLTISAQSSSKLNIHLRMRLAESGQSGKQMALLVKGDLNKIKQLTEKAGGIYKYGYRDIASISIPEKNVLKFSEGEGIDRIEAGYMRMTPLMDTARIRNNIDSANAGFAPLMDSMLGKGVLIGIVDGGIYWQHQDFKHSDGTTRIRYIWDQNAIGANPPQPYGYGNQWSWVDINQGNCTEVEGYTGVCADFGHGTCVAGIAAGNGTSVDGNPNLKGKYTGVAPESELIIVSVGAGQCVTDSPRSVPDAVDYIFKKADALGMPCVINISLGNYYGSHDGQDLQTQLIENILDTKKGQVIVAAAGNSGDQPYHLSYNITSDSAYTFFKYNSSISSLYFDFWADTFNFNGAYYAVGCSDRYGNYLGRTDYFNSTTNLVPTLAGILVTNTLYNGSIRLGVIHEFASIEEGKYHIEFQILPDSTSFLWFLKTQGTGLFDMWASSKYIGGSDMLDSLNGFYISDPLYRHPDYLKTMVSSFQNSDKIITVGNYSNRAGYLDYDSNYVDLTAYPYYETVGKRFATSSWGPTRDNRIKPDIMATGSTTMCTGDLNDIALKVSNGQAYKVALGGKHERNGGTSMSSPLVAGIVALYLQKRPTATYHEVKQTLICTAIADNFTGAVPNAEYGNGKVNAYQALIATGCVTFGAMDTGCINYNVLANVDSGGCIAKVYGCTDTLASNYNALANTDDGSCTFILALRNLATNNLSLSVQPNPFSGQTTFTLVNTGYSFDKGQIEVINQIGETITLIAVDKYTANYTFNADKVAKGIYFYRLKLDDKTAATGKLVVQ